MPSIQSLNKITLRHENIATTYLIGDIIEGYYAGGNFYLDNSHTQLIEGCAGFLYISLDSNKQYRYDETTHGYVVISGGGGGSSDSGLDIYADDNITALVIHDDTTIYIYPVDEFVAMVVNGGAVNDENQLMLLFSIGANEDNALIA